MAHPPVDYILKIIYAVQGVTHVANHGLGLVSDVPIGTPFDEIQIFNTYDNTTYLDFHTDQLAALIQPFYSSSDDISRAELWHKDGSGFAYDFVSVYDLSLAGTGGAVGLASQITFTNRTYNGGVSKFYLMETNIASNAVLRPPYTSSYYEDLATFMNADGNNFYNRDNTFNFASLGVIFGQNEALYRKRYR